MSTKISIEIIAEKPDYSGFFSTMLDLPAMQLQIDDAKERARYSDRPKRFQDIRIEESAGISLDNVRMDTTSIEELNFLAKRMDALSREDMLGFEALTEKYFSDKNEDDLISVKELINLTYNLDTVQVIPAISNLAELGNFAVENDFIEDLQGLPDSALKYLDYEAIGQEQLDNDEGAFVDGHYVVTVDYEPTEVYDGKHIPSTDESENAVFRLLVSKAPVDDPGEVMDDAQWLDLPMDADKLREFAEKLGADSIQNCVYYDFQTAIPYIDEDIFDSMKKIEDLNAVANAYMKHDIGKRWLFKMIIEGEGISDLTAMPEVFDRAMEYEFSIADDNADDFFKRYLNAQSHPDFDSKWFEHVVSHDDAQKVLDALGAHVTPYGIISARGKSLYDMVKYPDMIREITEPEKYELIEIIGRPALFSDGRISDAEIPDGLYRYDLRSGDNDLINGAIELNVYVDHAGSILVKEPIEFGESGYIQLDEDSSPNFTGEEMTAGEFAARDFIHDDDESFGQTGGMSL